MVKAKTKIMIIELALLFISSSFISISYVQSLGKWRLLFGLVGFALMGYMWHLPQMIRDMFTDEPEHEWGKI